MATLFFLGMYPRMEVNSLVPREAPVPFPVRIHAKARKAPPLTTDHCSCAVGRKRPPLCGGTPPATPPFNNMPRRPGADIRDRYPIESVSPDHVPSVLSSPRRGRPCACPRPPPKVTFPYPLESPVGAGLVPALARPQKVTFPYPLESPVGAGLVPAQDRRQVPPSHLTILAPNWITRFFEQPRGFTAFAENTVLCVSAEADLVRQEYGRACRIHRARMPGCVRGPGSDQLCGEYLLHAPTRP